MHVKGYTPNEVDKAELAKRTRDIDTNKIEPDTKQRFRARETEPDAAAIPPVSLKRAMENVRSAHELQADSDRQQAAQPAKDRAQAFAQKAPTEAVKDHPELVGTYAAMTSMEKKAQADNLTPQQQGGVPDVSR